MVSVQDKVVLITGASAGIGAAVAEHLASAGYKNLVLVARREKELNATADVCKAKGATNVMVLPRDLGKIEECSGIVQTIVEKFGRLDILIGNAGMGIDEKTENFTIADWEITFKVNTTANFILTKESLPYLRKTKGNIAFTSSVAATTACDDCAAYCASKAALNQFVKCVAKEEAKNGVRVNLVSPGIIVDDMCINQLKDIDHLDPEAKKEHARKAMAGAQPLGRPGEVEEMAKLFVFLVSDGNSFMTGSNIISDGGFSVEPP